MSEEWRTLVWLPHYEVSENGSVRRNGNCIYQLKNKSGHLQCCAWVNGKQIKCWVHRLVCEAWHGPPPFERAEAAHNDGNPGNNHYSNLRWATHRSNHQDRIRHGTSNAGERHPLAKLSWQDVRAIRAAAGTKSLQELATTYGVHRCHVGLIVRGAVWVERGKLAEV